MFVHYKKNKKPACYDLDSLITTGSLSGRPVIRCAVGDKYCGGASLRYAHPAAHHQGVAVSRNISDFHPFDISLI